MSLDTEKLHDALTARLGWLRGLARRLVVDDAVADDLVQDTVVAALKRPPELDRPLEPWLSKVLHRLHRQHRRGSLRRGRRERLAANEEAQADETDLVARLELVQQLVGTVRDLPEPFRTAVALRYESGLQPAEIARRLGVEAGTVRWRIHEGLKRIRARLDRENGSRKAWIALLLPLAEPHGLPVEPSSAELGSGGAAAWSAKGVVACVFAAALVVVGGAIVASTSFGDRPERRVTASNPAAFDDEQGAAADRSPVVLGPLPVEADEDPAAASPVPSATLRGRVLDGDGEPMRAARIGTIRGAPYAVAEQSPSLGANELESESTTEADGTFSLQASPGLLQLVVFDELERPTVSRALRLRPDEERTGITLTVLRSRVELPSVADVPSRVAQSMVLRDANVVWSDRASPAGLRVVARVRYGADRVTKLAGFYVAWQEPSRAPVEVGADGRVRIPVPADVDATSLGFEFFDARGSLGVRPCPSSATQDIVVHPRASLRGAVVQDPLETIQPGAIGVSSGDGHVYTCSIDAAGQFEFPALPPGNYELRWMDSVEPPRVVTAMTFVTELLGKPPVDVVLQPGESRQLVLDRQSLPLLRGVVRVDGEVPRHWQVDVAPPDRNGAPDVVQRALPLSVSGELHLRVPRAGVHELRLSTADGARVTPMYSRELEPTVEGTDFEVAIRTCVVSGRWQGERPKGHLWLRTVLPDGGLWLAPLVITRDGALVASRAAPGDADIVLAERDGATARDADPIGRLHVPEDGLSGIVLP